jgi:hypothetical protein
MAARHVLPSLILSGQYSANRKPFARNENGYPYCGDGEQGAQGMKLLKLINQIPYLLFVTVLPFAIFSCSLVFAAGFVLHTSGWWMVVAVPIVAALFGLFLGLNTLRKWGLHYSATIGELTRAMNRN